MTITLLGLPRTTLLVSSLALGAILITVFVTGLIRVVERAVDGRGEGLEAGAPEVGRGRLFILILGIVIGAWFLTFGALSLALGV